jgi:D-arabinose 5-phosphate isomerase GutQ
MKIIQLAKEVILAEAKALELVADQLGESFSETVQLLAECNGTVIVSGVGTTGTVARRLAHLLCNVGCPALFLHAGDSLHGSSGAVKNNDLLVLLSKTGETQETCQLAEIVHQRGTPIITLTAEPDSSIARLSQVVVSIKTPPEVDPYNGLMAVGSSLAMESVCDALVFCVLEVKGASQDRFVNGHPGGIINALSKGTSS